jgi:hypothetical protein
MQMHISNTSWRCVAPLPWGVTADTIRLCLFLFSLLGKAKQWFYAYLEDVTT